jgi:hypothetical protein
MLHRFYLVFIFFIACASCYSSNPAVKLTRKQWQEISKGVDFTETFKESKSESKQEGSAPKSVPFDFSAFKYIFYAIVAGLVLFLVIKILSNLNANPSIKQVRIGIDSMSEIEERMHEIDLDLLLEEALQAKNFRIALRIKFLIIIKMFTRKGDISWAKEKTNWEYYSEISDKNLAAQFKAIILGFERVWYGDLAVTEDQFNAVSPSYENLINQLSPSE